LEREQASRSQRAIQISVVVLSEGVEILAQSTWRPKLNKIQADKEMMMSWNWLTAQELRLK